MDSRIGSAPAKAPAGPSMESILAVRQAAKQMLRPPSRARRPSQQFPNVPVSEAVEQRFGHRLFVGPNDAEERPYIGTTDDEGRRHGEGTYTWDNGDTYEGEWVEDRREGHGTMTWASGARYDGDWMNDRQHGEGEFVSARGNKYIGEWFEGKRHGEGRARYKTTNNELYTGEFQNGKKHGNGKYKTNLGDFEGQWANGCKHGWGTFSRKVRYGEQESEYDGVYKKGKRTGFDRYKRAEQQRLEATEAAEAALALSSAPSANGTGNDSMDAVAVGEAKTFANPTATAMPNADVQLQVRNS